MGQWLRFRFTLVYFLFVLFFCFIGVRLIQLQVWVNPELHALATRQFERTSKNVVARLPILDRNGEELAVSVPAGSVFARPKLATRKKETARKLAKLLGGTPAKWLARLRTRKSFVWVQRQVNEELAHKIDKENMPGIFVQPENKRIYPNEQLAANTLGFTDIDGNGLAGLELSLNEELSQEHRQLHVVRDGKGNASYIDRYSMSEDGDMTGAYATIDRRIQHVLEEELATSFKETEAKSVLGIVMDPFTGEIFAMAQTPSFDPNQVGHSSPTALANRLVSYLYEPGSTLKTLLAAEAIDQGIMSPNTPVDCGNGEFSIGNKKIHEADPSHHWGIIPLSKVIRFSSNIGAIKIAQHLGPDRVRALFEKIGFGAKTGVELPGEVTASLKPLPGWTPFFLASSAFGQGFAVTPLQMVSAFASLANGGFMVRPKVLVKQNDASIEEKRIFSASTVKVMKDILVGVTEEKGGTGIPAAIPGIHVAGKTGTAQKYESGEGYGGGKYYSSFLGYLPADRPELVVAVMVDEPKGGYYATQVAAPLFKRVAERSLQILDRVPRKAIARNSTAKRPIVEAPVLAPTVVSEITPQADGQIVMPDLKGSSMRDTLRVLEKYFSDVRVSGSGYLENQNPKPGAVVTPASSIELTFSPQG